ncbi:hypothetical protein V5799_014771 [Amblyomma americanum]|uniref:Uncharacterized protein n=1 Tax=Amblyomma americanum TaxID=6943 RepID=A0AAQ4E224_AMBAM
MIYPPYVKPFDSTSSTEFIEAQLRTCVLQCKQLALPGDCDGVERGWVGGLALLLSDTGFLSHKSRAVQLMTACCHAHIMLSTISNVPYSRGSLVDVLQFLVDQLAMLGNSTDPLFEDRWELFKTVGHGKLFCDLHPKMLQFGTVVHHLFVALYDAISHNIDLISAGWQFLSPILNNLEPLEKTLFFTFAYLIPPLKKKKPFCYAVSKELVRNSSPLVQETIDALLQGAVSESSDGMSMAKSVHILDEVVRICPKATSLAFGQLAAMIESRDPRERFLAAQSVAYLASRRSLHLAPGSRWICRLYLERYADSCLRIQAMCFKETASFLDLREFSADVIDALLRTQPSSSASVRYFVTELVTEAALRNLEIITDQLIALLEANTHFASARVREKAISCLGKLYSSMAIERSCPRELVWRIANMILQVHKRKNAHDRMLVNQTYALYLVPVALSSSYRMELLYALYCNLGTQELLAFQCLHENLQQAQAKLKNLLHQAVIPDSNRSAAADTKDSLLIKELRKDKPACSNFLNALNSQQSSAIAFNRDAMLEHLRNTKSRALPEAERLLWSATLAALSKYDLEQLLNHIAELKPATSLSHAPRDLQLFKILSTAFPDIVNDLK